ncbi:hypothetical protein [Nonomuraea turkmeniaca]|uniref:hypothetical protein n=1 Tax=Nonomuraea turkmeniaca TaxID=103838 RepID=UPI001FE738D1|nr:hypothetical protein [Nonomuraea turkmeniaca]
MGEGGLGDEPAGVPQLGLGAPAAQRQTQRRARPLLGRPMAASTGEDASLPSWQAEPVEAAI